MQKIECAELSSLPSTKFEYNAVSNSFIVKNPYQDHGIEVKTELNGTRVEVRNTFVDKSKVIYESAWANDGNTLFLKSLTDSDGKNNYDFRIQDDDSGYVPFMYNAAIDASGHVKEIMGHTLFGQMTMFQESERIWNINVSSHPGNYRVYGYSKPEGDSIQFDRDQRNNITKITSVPKPNSTMPRTSLYSASYPTECLNPITCNRPTSVRDAKNNQTEYTYAPEHGGVLSETLPPGANGVRPQKRYEYVQKYAWVKNASGGFTQESSPIWLKVKESSCSTSAATGNPANACSAGATDEVVTRYEYEEGSATRGSNLLLTSMTVTAANGAGQLETLRTCYRYDDYGRKVSETKPKAGLASCP